MLSLLNQNHTAHRSGGLDLSGSQQGAGGIGGLLFIFDSVGGSAVMESYAPAYDSNGSVMTLTRVDDGDSSAGDLAARYEYDPYGNELVGPISTTEIAPGNAAPLNPFRFSTKYRDEFSGMLYLGHRYYNPSTGNWLSRDPIEEQGGSNVYGYVGNEPVGRVDYLGMWGQDVHEGKTKEWAIDMRMKNFYALSLGKDDIGTDGTHLGYAFDNYTEEWWSKHFNMNNRNGIMNTLAWGSGDTRYMKSEEAFEKAVTKPLPAEAGRLPVS